MQISFMVRLLIIIKSRTSFTTSFFVVLSYSAYQQQTLEESSDSHFITALEILALNG